MRSLIIFFFTVLVIVSGCKDKSAPHPDNPNLFGATLSEGAPITLGELITQLESTGEVKNVKVKGTVESVCQAKGCWMNLKSDDFPGKLVFVKFHDYGFFVPKDIAGMDVILEGNAYIEETSVDELKHYAEDEGKTAEEIAAITAPVEEMKFMATGVEVIRP